MVHSVDTVAAPEVDHLYSVERTGDVDRATRLLCARLYLYGLPFALIDFFRMIGPPCAGFERDVGLDRRTVMFHCCQSLLLSLSVLAVATGFYFLAPAQSTASMVVVQLLVFGKIAVLNPWLARRYFGRRPRALRVPVLHSYAEAITNRLAPWTALCDQNAVYFAGDRPFVGYGAEVNAWTVVIDTRVPSRNSFMGPAISTVGPDAPAELYAAVEEKARGLAVAGIDVDRVVCVDGRTVAESPDVPRLRRPGHTLDTRAIAAIDNPGDQGRCYLLLAGASRQRDVLVTQFVRFSKTGHLIFCEFASHLVPPVSRTVARLDTLFGYHPLVYALVGFVLYAFAAFVATLTGPFVEGLLWLGPLSFLNHLGLVSSVFPNYFYEQIAGGWFAYRIVGVTLVFLLVVIASQVARRIATFVLLALALKTNYGIFASYRERWSTTSRLRYFELQEAIRLLKIHEQVLLSAVIEWLEAHGIDASPFKETVSAFINQGVINTGQIGGNVATKVGSIVFRRGPKSRARRKGAA